MESGLLAKPTHVSRHAIAGIWVAFFSRCQRCRCGQGTIIRLSPPLVIDDDQAAETLRILRKVFLAL